MDYEFLYALVWIISLIIMMFSWVVFGRLSMARIEKSIMAEGKPRPCSWDGVGGRIIWYAYTVALPARFFNKLDDRQLNTADVKRYTTRADRIRAWVLMISGHTMMVMGLLSSFFGIA